MTSPGPLTGHTLAGRYEVVDLLGVGGMGEVYRAWDRELDDVIALKLIRGELLAQPDIRELFRKEVKLARRVTHRNVARAYELVIAPEATFYTMELIEGSSLARRIRTRGYPAFADALAIVTAVCDALAAAHEVGVIHRDVKPENILLGGDRIVLVDFGIAAVAHRAAEVAGTPRYMAPEQASGGEPTVAADIYSLGVVLYELLARAPAFDRAVALDDRPDHLDLPGIEPELAQALARATARAPAARYHSAAAFRRALAPYVGESPSRPSVASLTRAAPIPTIVIRRDTDQVAPAHLVDGVHQAIVDRLAEWPRLRVAIRIPDDRIVEGVADLRVLDDELLLTATAGPRALELRLPFDIAQLVRTADSAARVLAALMGSVAAVPPLRDRSPPPEALELILRARHVARRDRARLPEAVTWCERALAIAPAHSRIEAVLATCHAQLAFYRWSEGEAQVEQARAYAFAALGRDPRLAEAHFARAHVELQRGQPVHAAVSFRMAISLAPQSGEAHEWLGRLLLEAGFAVDAQARFSDAAALGAPPALGWELAISRALAGQWHEVDAMLVALRDVGADRGLGYLLRIASWRGVRDDASYRAFAALSDHETFQRSLILAIHDPELAWEARRARIRTHVEASRTGTPRHQAFIAQLASEAAGLARDVDECLSWLLHASACGLFDLPWIERCPSLRAVRDQPRFEAIRRDVAARAHAVHDALFGDHRDEATLATDLS